MQSTSQILVFSRPDYTIAAIAGVLQAHPDSIWSITDEKSIKIDIIRRLQQELSTNSSTNIRHVVIYPAERITQQAQHSLLKLLEEPPPNTQITLVTSAVSQVLSTIQSRCVVRLIATKQTERAEQSQSSPDSLFQQLTSATSWKDVVTLTQTLPTKREELRELLRNEYTQTFPQTELAVIFQEMLADVLVALNHNVQPALCAERLVLGTYQTYQKAAGLDPTA